MGFVQGDCSLGNDLRFEIPADIEQGDLIDKDGYLFNATSGTIYIYCDEYPEYSFRLSSFSGVEYRTNSNNYSYSDMPLKLDSAPVLRPALADVILFAALLISALLIICKGGAKRA